MPYKTYHIHISPYKTYHKHNMSYKNITNILVPTKPITK